MEYNIKKGTKMDKKAVDKCEKKFYNFNVKKLRFG